LTEKVSSEADVKQEYSEAVEDNEGEEAENESGETEGFELDAEEAKNTETDGKSNKTYGEEE